MKKAGPMIGALGLFLFVQSAPAVWTPAKRLTWTSADSMDPAIAVDSFHIIHIVWSETLDILYKRSTDGGLTWSASKRMTGASSQAWNPAISISLANTIHVVWQSYAPGSFEIYYKRSMDHGITWSAAKRLTWTMAYSENPAIAYIYNGVHVIWNANCASGKTDLYYRRSTNEGYSWMASRRLTWTPDWSVAPVMAIDSSAVIHTLWTDYTPLVWSVYYKKSPDGGATWGAAKRLTWGSYSSSPAMVVDSKDRVYIVWTKGINDSTAIFHRKSIDKGDTWSMAKRLTWNSGESWGPAIAVDPSDVIHLVWEDDTPGNAEIYYEGSTDGGGTWSAAKRLTVTSGASQNPAISEDNSGGIHVVWEDDSHGNKEIYYRSDK